MAESRNDLREKLKVAGGGIVFTNIQKFFPEDEKDKFPLLSELKNIVVVGDEAHRTQYGFEIKTRYLKDDAGSEVGSENAYGFAKITMAVILSCDLLNSVRKHILCRIIEIVYFTT